MTSPLKDDANTLRHQTAQIAADAKENLSDAAYQAGRKVRGMMDTASDQYADAAEAMTSKIRRHPVGYSLSALILGFALGAMARR